MPSYLPFLLVVLLGLAGVPVAYATSPLVRPISYVTSATDIWSASTTTRDTSRVAASLMTVDNIQNIMSSNASRPRFTPLAPPNGTWTTYQPLTSAGINDRWWIIDYWSSLQGTFSGFSATFTAASNTIGNWASGEVILILPINIAYGSSGSNCVWFQFSIQFNWDNSVQWDIQDNNCSPIGYHITDISLPYVVGHSYVASMSPSSTSPPRAKFSITDTTSGSSWSMAYVVPTTSMVYADSTFSPASALEGVPYRSSPSYTNVPCFPFTVQHGHTTVIHQTFATTGFNVPTTVNTQTVQTATQGTWYWSMIGAVSPPSAVPSLISPGDGVTVSTTTPVLQWTSVPGATFYMPEVWQGGTLVWRDWPSTTSFTVPSGMLFAGVTYQWRVYAANSAGYGTASVFRSFTVAGGGPPSSAPTLVSPADASTVPTTTPTLSWSSVSGATFYMPEVWRGGALVWRDWPGATSMRVPSGFLTAGQSYQWRVYAANSAGYGSASGFWSFTVAGGLSAPTLVSPADGSTVSTTSPTLCWTGVSAATFYMPEVWQGGTLVWRDWPGATCIMIPAGRLTNGVAYQWHVYAANSQGYGPPSTSWSFTITGGLSAPTLISPVDGATVSITTPTLQWNAVSGATFYMVEVWQGGTIVWRDWPGATSMRVPSGFLTAGQSYQWRVYAANSVGYGPPSAFRTFSVAA